MKKKYIFFILLGLFLFLPGNTFALDVNLGSPTSVDLMKSSGGAYTTNPLAVNWYGYNGYASQINNAGSFTYPTSYTNEVFYYNYGYCQGKPMTVDVDVMILDTQSRSSYFPGTTGFMIASNGTTSTTCSLQSTALSSRIATFRCNFNNATNILSFNLSLSSYQSSSVGSREVGYAIINTSSLSCSTSTSDITNSVNSAANNIINNNNSNTNRIIDSQNQTKQSIDETNNILNDSDISQSQQQANSFFNNFENEDFGLSGVITAPLEFIKSLSSSTCSPLQLTIPFVPGNNTIDLPCMTTIYSQYFGSILTIYQTLTFGLIAYYVVLDIFRMVQGFKNPNSDKIEVVDL